MILASTAGTESALNIDSVKKFLDGLDPAALLPDLTTVVGRLELVCRIAVLVGPVVLLELGLSYLFLTPKEANYYLGYRCYYGMGSVQAWRFSQRIAGLIFGGLGLVLTVVMFFLSVSFRSSAPMDMAWSAFRCLIWQAVLTLLATLAVNLLCVFFFDAKGEPRRKQTK